MDFGLSPEQALFDDALLSWVEGAVPTGRVRRVMVTEEGTEDAIWTELGRLGVPGLLVPLEFGGSGLALLDAAVVARVMGWGAVPAPFLGTAVMAPVALREGASPEVGREWLPRIARGETRIGVALTEVFSRREDAGGLRQGDRLFGKALFVVDASTADAFLVAAGADTLALVPRDTPGLAIEALATIDHTRRVGELLFDSVRPADWIEGAGRVIERTIDAGRIAVAADILGACDRALAMAVAYAKERKQFGRVIGSFQAVKHLCAEMAAELEPARSLVWYAAHAFDAVPADAPLVAAHAKAHSAEVGTALVKTATEVHGGIGFTDAYDLHLWFKRVALDRQLLGGPDVCRARAAVVQGWEQ